MNIDPLLGELWLVALIALAVGAPPVLPQKLLNDLAWEAQLGVLLGYAPLN